MKLLFLTSRFPFPPDRGDRLTVLNLLRAFAGRHETTLVSFTDGGEPPEAATEVARHCRHIETVPLSRARSWFQAWLGIASATPSQVSYYRSATMNSRVRRLLTEEHFDIIFNHTIRVAPYVLEVPHPLKVLWLGDSLGLVLRRSMEFAPPWKRPGIAWEARRVDRFEAHISQRFRETWALSASDQRDLVRVGCRSVALVPHGVDERLFDIRPRRGGPPCAVFLGNLAVPHNVDAAVYAAREIWPEVRRTYTDARLRLAGASPAPAVKRLDGLAGVEVTGFVPDLRDIWESAHLLLAPLRFSTGIQNKVLEAMAAGVPVVTTGQVAEGVEARAPEHLLVGDSRATLAAGVIETLGDPVAAAERAQRAREHVRARYTWSHAVQRIEDLAAGRAPIETALANEGSAPSMTRSRES